MGALSALGLRLSKNDGRVKGKFELNADKLSVCELLKTGFIDEVVDENFK
ncbi:hypothetical protein [Campylobacter gastrosuis]|uniref:Uncharacterized protein n=1 Tax=Campylobacter gastrosuis TaxID=2974576 RepID=A0ABT7HRZ1_9BACT|nr:hypothetical protein [Campylobacter gastrosuis]MDL0089589.1 hypothetical protein [Campylobacter gastrosuis]